jgi:PAP2 superfamily
MISKLLSRFLAVWLVIALFISGCVNTVPSDTVEQKNVADFAPTVALKWNEQYLDLERNTDGYRPPISARTLGYIGLATYESVVNGMPTYKSIASRYAGLSIPVAVIDEVYDWPTVLNSCYATSMKNYFPTAPAAQLFNLYSLENVFNNEFKSKIPEDVFNRSVDYGKRVADAVYEYSKTDAVGHEAFKNPTDKNYPDGTVPGQWRRTAPDFSNPLLPNWGTVRTWSITEDEKKIPVPIPYSESTNSRYYVQAKEIQNLVNDIKAGKEYEQNWIGIFWSDDCPKVTFTPAGRWIAIANQVVKDHAGNLEKALMTYVKVGMALSDAGVAAWHEKYRYKIERPVTYIQNVLGDKDWKTNMCPTGNGVYVTPPFPAYPSGHATFGGAAAEVLTAEYGAGLGMTDRCHEGRTDFIGTPRSFDNFYQMAEENGYSRIPIGVHWRMDADEGVKLGYRIARKVNRLPWKK